MGGLCSKNSSSDANNNNNNNNKYSNNTLLNKNLDSSVDFDRKISNNKQPIDSNSNNNKQQPAIAEATAEVEQGIGLDKQSKESFSIDDFYDGIPRYQSLKSRSFRKRLGRAGIEVLDTLGSSMTNLNKNNGFASTVSIKGNELGILAFEVANTIVKGSTLMHSLSKWNIRHLKEVVFPSEGVQNLISTDMDQLLKIVEADKREELKIFSGEVVRFGNKCKDPQWHNLDRYFEKMSRNITHRPSNNEEAVSVMEVLMTLVQYTAELYRELQVLDRIEQEYEHKRQEGGNRVGSAKGDNLAKLRLELKSINKQIRILKKRSLWSRSLEEVMEKLIDIVNFLLVEIYNTFGRADGNECNELVNDHRRLGPAGLSLHYANIIVQIDTLVARSSSMPQSTRDSLYQNLPPSIKSALHSKLRSFHVKEELTITEIKDEMEKTLQWLVPMSTNTAKAHHGFGWVGEWGNSGSEANRKSAATAADIIRIETLYHADKDITESYILDLTLWLHHLAIKSKPGLKGANKKLSIKSSVSSSQENSNSNQQPKNELPDAPPSTIEEQ